MYSEITMPYLGLSGLSTTGKLGGYIFGRSVIVTAAYFIKHTAYTATATGLKCYLCRQSTIAATKTVFASLVTSATDTVVVVDRCKAFTVTAKTFSATQCITVRASTNKTGSKHASIIVRYKEK